ncbi:tyrosine-protein kinase Fer isoform X1 [Lates japonicus]|uniref:Tyrosine-protein kinase Fer isoform X1 n=1 Tax=Lates japonicus TaxID=270547 RepID=A0AAD3NIT3_LATJO|nr:tyrosine-protein kinase Fer isoform X1 [Lates japonicus]
MGSGRDLRNLYAGITASCRTGSKGDQSHLVVEGDDRQLSCDFQTTPKRNTERLWLKAEAELARELHIKADSSSTTFHNQYVTRSSAQHSRMNTDACGGTSACRDALQSDGGQTPDLGSILEETRSAVCWTEEIVKVHQEISAAHQQIDLRQSTNTSSTPTGLRWTALTVGHHGETLSQSWLPCCALLLSQKLSLSPSRATLSTAALPEARPPPRRALLLDAKMAAAPPPHHRPALPQTRTTLLSDRP